MGHHFTVYHCTLISLGMLLPEHGQFTVYPCIHGNMPTYRSDILENVYYMTLHSLSSVGLISMEKFS